MQRVYIPASGLGSWKSRLSDPEKHWVRTRSAFETAVFWELGARQPRGLHPRLAALLDGDPLTRGSELVAAFPEHQVALPGGARPSQTDVWAILRGPQGLVSLAVEGKAGESFDRTVGEWRRDASAGKEARLAFLCQQLGLDGEVEELRYQLLHRTVSALVEAERAGASVAVMLVLSFRDDPESRADFDRFGARLGVQNTASGLQRASTVEGLPLVLGWLDAPCCTDAEVAAAEG